MPGANVGTLAMESTEEAAPPSSTKTLRLSAENEAHPQKMEQSVMARRAAVSSASQPSDSSSTTVFGLPAASVTMLRCGPDFVVAAGLCGRLRAWRQKPAASTSGGGAGSTSSGGGEGAWELVLDEESTYDLPNGRRSTHPYRCLALADGLLAAATTHAEGHVAVWETVGRRRTAGRKT